MDDLARTETSQDEVDDAERSEESSGENRERVDCQVAEKGQVLYGNNVDRVPTV